MFGGDRCVLTWIPLALIQLSCDRVFGGRYNEQETMPIWERLNDAKEAAPFVFESQEAFDKYCLENQVPGDHPLLQYWYINSQPTERLVNFQIKKRAQKGL